MQKAINNHLIELLAEFNTPWRMHRRGGKSMTKYNSLWHTGQWRLRNALYSTHPLFSILQLGHCDAPFPRSLQVCRASWSNACLLTTSITITPAAHKQTASVMWLNAVFANTQSKLEGKFVFLSFFFSDN